VTKATEEEGAGQSADVSAATRAVLATGVPPAAREVVEEKVFTAAELLAEAYRVLQPGTQFRGHIKVPGIEEISEESRSSSPSTYDLIVLSWGKTMFGKPVIYVSHEAYEDRQVGHPLLHPTPPSSRWNTPVGVAVFLREKSLWCGVLAL
jgi:hypothetical protein